MPRPSTQDIRLRIRNGVVEVAVSKGIGAAGVAEIARAARVSPGTIYLHFADKDALLQQSYLEIKHEFHARMMAAATADGSAAIIRGMWLNLFAFLRDRPLDYRFLEYAGAAQVLTPAQRAAVAPLQAEINALLQAAMDNGTIRALPMTVTTSLLLGPALHLARLASLGEHRPDPSDIDQTFDRVWACLTP